MLKTLAEIVLEAKLASSDELERAVDASDRDGKPLVEHLVREAEIDEVALVAALRRQLRVPVADPATVNVEADALRTLSQDVCRRRRVMPLAVIYEAGNRRLRLAMADPTDAIALAEVEHRTGLDIEPALMTLSTVTELVEKEYKKIVTEVMRRHRPTERQDPPFATVATPRTAPFHRISDEAGLAERFEALLRLLVENKIISEDEFEDQVRQLLKERDSGV